MLVKIRGGPNLLGRPNEELLYHVAEAGTEHRWESEGPCKESWDCSVGGAGRSWRKHRREKNLNLEPEG